MGGEHVPEVWTISVLETPEGRKIPKYCIFCGQCITVCPVHAIHFQQHNNIEVLTVDENMCDLCGGGSPKCVQICPSEVIKISPVKGFPIMCDLCGGDPECVRICPNTAIAARILDSPTIKYLKNL